MSERQNLRPPKRPGNSSKYKPQFVNPHPLPSQDEFRLDHIVTKVLREESKTVSDSLLNVCSSYQQDLKGEIRKVLALEQKIQNKNIHATKRTHKLTNQWQEQRKAHAKVRSGESGTSLKTGGISLRKKGSLGAEIDGLLAQTVEVSAGAKNLAMRMSEVSKKRGMLGPPDPQKYPKLNKLMGVLNGKSGPASLNEVHPHSDGIAGGDGSSNNRQNKHEETVSISSSTLKLKESDTKASNSQTNSQKNVGAVPPSLQILEENEDRKEGQNGGNFTVCGHEIPNSPTSKSDPGRHLSPMLESDSMDSTSFEHFMDVSIAKYRKKKDSRNLLAGSPFLGPGLLKFSHKTPSDHVPRNPIRLLSSGSLGSVALLVKLLPVIDTEDPLKYSFLPRKSAATVYENPEMSLHKKLRIRTMPSPLHSPSKSSALPKCECQTSTTTSNDHESPKVTGLVSTHRNGSVSEGELWSSSEAPTEAESDDLDSSSSSDEGSSSESLDGQIGATNSYYRQFQSSQKLKLRRNRRHQYRQTRNPDENASFRSEPSPRPKHKPLHRVLQPKQSILKLSKSAVDKARKVKTESPVDSASSDIESRTGTGIYTASPRASFVNECAVVGVILHETENTGESDVDKSMHREGENGENGESVGPESVSVAEAADCSSGAGENERPPEAADQVLDAGAAEMPQMTEVSGTNAHGADKDEPPQSQAIDMLRSLML